MDQEILQTLSQFPVRDVKDITAFGTGRLHATYRIDTNNGTHVLQRMGPMIAPQVMEDIERATTHLKSKGVLTYQVIRTNAGGLVYSTDEANWRMLTYIPGTTITKTLTVDQAQSAARCVADFHSALRDYTQPFANRVPIVFNSALAFSNLRRVFTEYSGTGKSESYAPLVEEILKRGEKQIHEFENLPLRVLHGDPKLTNIRFDENGKEAIAMIDLDTIGLYHLPLELGDMLRSWCKNDSGLFRPDIWKAALHEYRLSAPFLTQAEWIAIPDGFVTITLALAATYITDAFEERYFAHEADSFATLSEQNSSQCRRYIALLDSFAVSEKEIRKFHE